MKNTMTNYQLEVDENGNYRIYSQNGYLYGRIEEKGLEGMFKYRDLLKRVSKLNEDLSRYKKGLNKLNT